MLKKFSSKLFILPLIIMTFVPTVAEAQLSDEVISVIDMSLNYNIHPKIKYLTANNQDLYLDIYQNNNPGLHPTLIFIHGGGWVARNKDVSARFVWPYLAMGFSVVHVEYRVASMYHAPAAVEDNLCALRWVIQNAEEYGFDPDKIVVAGNSAGGHLALTTGMIPAEAGLDRQCPGSEKLKVAAIINVLGPTNVNDLLAGPNMRNYAVAWLGSQSDREEIARRVSPINYVRQDLPPILTVHGEVDPVVPYTHAVRLHQALDEVGAPNQLLTIFEKGHGDFSREENLQIYTTIQQFLIEHGVLEPSQKL